MYFGLENEITMLLFFIGIIIVLRAQFQISSSYKKYSEIKNKFDLTGQEVARKILDANGLNDIYVIQNKGELTDHYDPTRKVVKLSKGVFGENTIAAISIAAHEVGHAIQDKEGYTFMKIRSALVPVVNFISYVGYFALFISIIGGITGYLKTSIFIILATLVFQLVTLPVEFNASKRGKEQLIKLGLIDTVEMSEVSNMLNAAAMTYVASFISSLLNLLRLVIMLGGRDD